MRSRSIPIRLYDSLLVRVLTCCDLDPRSWRLFGGICQQWAHQVASHPVQSRTQVTLRDPDNLDLLINNGWPIRMLTLDLDYEVTVDPPRSWAQLTYLHLYDITNHDFSFLDSLKSLETLRIEGVCGSIANFNKLDREIPLQTLCIDQCDRITDLSHLKYFTSLSELTLCSSTCSDFSFIRSLSQLQSLDLTCCLVDNCDLALFPTTLVKLVLETCDRITEVDPLAKLTQLRYLDLSHCEFIESVRPLATLNLNFLSITDTAISTEGVQAVLHLPYVEAGHLDGRTP